MLTAVLARARAGLVQTNSPSPATEWMRFSAKHFQPDKEAPTFAARLVWLLNENRPADGSGFKPARQWQAVPFSERERSWIANAIEYAPNDQSPSAFESDIWKRLPELRGRIYGR